MSRYGVTWVRKAMCASALALAMAAGGHRARAAGETVTVDTLNDVADFAGARQVDDLPGPDGRISFREACIAVNNTAGPQTIEFAIPQSEWWLYSDRAILRQENGIFALTDDETTVDFSSQVAFTGDTNPNGNEVGVYGLEANAWGVASIWVFGDNCVIKGLDRVMQRGYGVQIQGNVNRVIGCTISGPLYAGVYITGGFGGPTPTGNVIGGTAPGEGNVLSAGNHGVRIDAPADDNAVIGNVLTGVYSGVAVRGSIYTTSPNNNRIGGPTPEERNVIAGAGQYGEEGFPDGQQVKIEYAHGTIVEGNYIGTTPDGMAREPQIGPVGVRVRESTDTVVRNNLISGLRVQGVNHYAGQLFGVAVLVDGDSDGTQIVGNLIGTDAAGTQPIPTLNGISAAWFDGVPTRTSIGGVLPGEGNVIAFTERVGVAVGGSIAGVSIRGNAIFENGGLGIELASGANGNQAAPVLTAATSSGANTIVEGSLSSTPNTTFDIEFFANGVCDPSGFGEGETFLGSASVTTSGAGAASFSTTLPVGLAEGVFVTATATSQATGNTSEFSACVSVAAGAAPGDLDGDGDVDLDDFGVFAACYGGANNPPAAACPPGVDADLDGDGDVDLDDFSIFAQNFTGAF